MNRMFVTTIIKQCVDSEVAVMANDKGRIEGSDMGKVLGSVIDGNYGIMERFKDYTAGVWTSQMCLEGAYVI